jgi:hypothetical protein
MVVSVNEMFFTEKQGWITSIFMAHSQAQKRRMRGHIEMQHDVNGFADIQPCRAIVDTLCCLNKVPGMTA